MNKDIMPSGVRISSAWKGDIDQLARQIRNSPFWCRLLLTEVPHESPLIAGNCSLAGALKKSLRFDFLAPQLHIALNELADIRRLLFLIAIRQNFKHIPQFERASKGRYVYPLAQACALNWTRRPSWRAASPAACSSLSAPRLAGLAQFLFASDRRAVI